LFIQVAALVWLKDNIGGFGGDSNRITLSGHGTGAALVNLLMISPLAAGRFLSPFLFIFFKQMSAQSLMTFTGNDFGQMS
jgi:acetyl esterase/lipase